MKVTEVNKKKVNKLPSEQYDSELKKMRKEHDKPVKGMFEFIDAQGGWLDFSYRFFPGEPLRTIKLVHGEICELPMGIVRHLNNCKKKIRTFNKEILDGTKSIDEVRGLPSTYTVQSRVRFTPVDMF